MAWNLPKLPGYSFEDVTKTRFHVPRKMDYKNGVPIVKLDYKAVGGKYMDAEKIDFIDTRTSSRLNTNLIYDKKQTDCLPIYKPHWVHYDKKFLTFKGHFKESPSASSDEIVIRRVIILYYLEDDTLTVIEPHIHNSGLIQGKLVKRGRIKKSNQDDFWHWKDLRIGMDLPIFGLVVHVASCDEFTRNFMSSQGIDLSQDEDEPNASTTGNRIRPRSVEKSDRFLNFLNDDGRMLKFEVICNDGDDQTGETRVYKLLFFLFDKSIAIKEFHVKNEGRDPFPMLLRRMKVPKNWRGKSVNHPIFTQEVLEDDEELYEEADLLIGNTIDVLGRKFLIYDCDDFTRRYYKNVLNIDQKEALTFQEQADKPRQLIVAPHIGIGDPEDTLMSCLSFHCKSPRKNLVQYNLNANKYLRYLCEMISIYPEDKDRKFILSYHLADDLIRMDELPSKNSGLPAGRFSGPSKLQIPGGDLTDYYKPDMFYIGAIITVKNRKFRISGADLFVYNYMKENPDKFPSELVENMRDYQAKRASLKTDLIDKMDEITTQVEHARLQDDDQVKHMDAGEIEWKPSELPAPLQELECAQILPENMIKEDKGQQIVCFTGVIPETHAEEHEADKAPLIDEIPKDPEPSEMPASKRVSFKNTSDEFEN